MKKIFTLILTAIMLLAITCPAQAAVAETVQPRYTYIKTVTADLSINRTTGVATCEGKITAFDTNPVKVVVHLQVYQDGRWQTLLQREQTGTGSAYLSRTYTVSSGYTYRCYVIGYVYDSNGVMKEAGTDSQTFTF